MRIPWPKRPMPIQRKSLLFPLYIPWLLSSLHNLFHPLKTAGFQSFVRDNSLFSIWGLIYVAQFNSPELKWFQRESNPRDPLATNATAVSLIPLQSIIKFMALFKQTWRYVFMKEVRPLKKLLKPFCIFHFYSIRGVGLSRYYLKSGIVFSILISLNYDEQIASWLWTVEKPIRGHNSTTMLQLKTRLTLIKDLSLIKVTALLKNSC